VTSGGGGQRVFGLPRPPVSGAHPQDPRGRPPSRGGPGAPRRWTRGEPRLGRKTDAIGGPGSHHGGMSAAAFTPGPVHQHGPASGATALSAGRRRHLLGDTLRAVKVFAGAALGVVVLGEYGEETGVRRR
jgi:hypothetical protein